MLRFYFVLVIIFFETLIVSPAYAADEPTQARLDAMRANTAREMLKLQNLNGALETLEAMLQDKKLSPDRRIELERQLNIFQGDFNATAQAIKNNQSVINGKTPLGSGVPISGDEYRDRDRAARDALINKGRDVSNIEKPQTILDAAKKIQPAQVPPDSVAAAGQKAAKAATDFFNQSGDGNRLVQFQGIDPVTGEMRFTYTSNGGLKSVITASQLTDNVIPKAAAMHPDYRVSGDVVLGSFAEAQAVVAAQSISSLIGRSVRPRADGLGFDYFSNSEKKWKELLPSDYSTTRGLTQFHRGATDPNKIEDVIKQVDRADALLSRAGMVKDPLIIPPEIAKLVAEKIGYFSADMTFGRERNGSNPSTYFNLVYDPLTKEFIGIERVRQIGTYHTPDWASDRDFVSFTGKKPPLTAVVIPAVINEHYAPSADKALPWERGEPIKPAEYKFDVRDTNELQRIISQGEAVAQEAARRAAAQKAAQAAMPKIEPPKAAPVVKPRFRFFR